MRYPKATKRRHGGMMMTTTIKVHIGEEELSNALIDMLGMELHENQRETLDGVTRAKLWEQAVSNIESRGINWFPEGRDVDDIKDEFGDEINAKVFELFPELRRV